MKFASSACCIRRDSRDINLIVNITGRREVANVTVYSSIMYNVLFFTDDGSPLKPINKNTFQVFGTKEMAVLF